jgi:hypothetical protein
MQDNAVVSDEAIFNDVSETIKKALQATHAEHADKSHIAKAAFTRALKSLL